jgi:peptide-methionine (S)-S-oxide reductase
MADPDLLDSLFCEAVSAIDAGDVITLEQLLARHPGLLRERLDSPGGWLRDKAGGALEGFFARPYLLWFVAEDPVRNRTLPANIALVARAIIRAAEREGVENLQEQLDYALRLVAWSFVARDCGVQIGLIDVLIDAGASFGSAPEDAIVNDNFDAARHLIERGAKLTLAAALCLGREDAAQLAQTADARQRQFSFVLAALKGKAEALALLLGLGVDLNAPSADLFAHATPVHHAVSSGSLDAVKVLVEAGAALDRRDTVHGGTPLGWAEHAGHAEIASYLRERGVQPE